MYMQTDVGFGNYNEKKGSSLVLLTQSQKLNIQVVVKELRDWVGYTLNTFFHEKSMCYYEVTINNVLCF